MNNKIEVKLPPLMAISNGGHTYLCTYKNEWDPVLKRSRRVAKSSKVVAKVKDGKTGEIIWYDDFIKEHPNLRVYKANRVLKSNDGKRSIYEIEYIKLNAVADYIPSSIEHKHVGAISFLDDIINHNKMYQRLINKLNERDCDIVLAFLYYTLIYKTTSLTGFNDFITKSKFPFAEVLDKDIIKYLNKLNISQINLSLLNKDKKAKVNEDNFNYLLDTCSINDLNASTSFEFNTVIYDVLKKTNCLCFIDSKVADIYYYKTYIDEKIPFEHIEKVYFDNLIKKPVLVSDRFFTNLDSVNILLTKSMNFIIRINSGDAFVHELIEQNIASFFETANFIPEINATTVCIKAKYHGKDMYVHIFKKKSLILEDVTNENKIKSVLNSSIVLMSNCISEPLESYKAYFDKQKLKDFLNQDKDNSSLIEPLMFNEALTALLVMSFNLFRHIALHIANDNIKKYFQTDSTLSKLNDLIEYTVDKDKHVFSLSKSQKALANKFNINIDM